MPKSSTRTPSGTAAPAAAARPRRRSRRHRGRCCRSRPPARVTAAPLHRQGLDLVGVEVQVPAGARSASVAGSSSTVTATCSSPSTSWNTPATVGDHAVEEHVVRVGAARRVQPHRVPVRDLDAGDEHGVGPRVDRGVDRGLPPRQRRLVLVAARRRDSAARSSRMVPCRRAHTSGAMSSMRSTIAAARGSVPRASAFSSSVRVSTRSARISSISVASTEVAVALGRDRRVVVEDDRRRQHHACRRRRRAPGTCPRWRSPRRRPRRIAGGSSSETNVAVVDREQHVDRDQRVPHGDVTRALGVGPVGGVLDRRPTTFEELRRARRPSPTLTRTRRPRPARAGARTRPTTSPRRGTQLLDCVRARQASTGDLTLGVREREQRDRGEVELVLDRLVPRHPAVAVDLELGRRRANPIPGPAAPRRCGAAPADTGPARSTAGRRRGRRCTRCGTTSARSRRPRRTRGGTSTPNCQRSWFFGADARYG